AACQASRGHAHQRRHHSAGHSPDWAAGQSGGRIPDAVAWPACRSWLHAWDPGMNVAMQQGQRLTPPAPMSITRLTWINVTKDLRLEWRSRDVFNSMMFFALVVVVVFSLSFEREDSRLVLGGLIWVAFLFSTTMALNQSWARELRNGVLDAYRVSPAPAE